MAGKVVIEASSKHTATVISFNELLLSSSDSVAAID